MSTNMPEFKSDPVVTAMIPAMQRVRELATGMVIRTAAGYESAAQLLKSIKGQLAAFEDARTKITKPINDGLKEINAQHRATVAPLLADEQTIKHAMLAYSDEQDRLRKAEQQRANEAAAREQRRLQAIADEAARKAREEAEVKRRAAEEAAAAGRDEEAAKLAAQAQRIDDRAAAKVEMFENRAAQVVAPVAQQQAPKVGGISVPMVWTFEIVDAALIPREYLDVNETRIRKVVQAMQGNTNIPGVQVKQIKRIAAGMA